LTAKIKISNKRKLPPRKNTVSLALFKRRKIREELRHVPTFQRPKLYLFMAKLQAVKNAFLK